MPSTVITINPRPRQPRQQLRTTARRHACGTTHGSAITPSSNHRDLPSRQPSLPPSSYNTTPAKRSAARYPSHHTHRIYIEYKIKSRTKNQTRPNSQPTTSTRLCTTTGELSHRQRTSSLTDNAIRRANATKSGSERGTDTGKGNTRERSPFGYMKQP